MKAVIRNKRSCICFNMNKDIFDNSTKYLGVGALGTGIKGLNYLSILLSVFIYFHSTILCILDQYVN